MTALDHLKRYPHARPSTIIRKARQEALHEKMRREIEEQKRKPWGKRLWPSWVWRW